MHTPVKIYKDGYPRKDLYRWILQKRFKMMDTPEKIYKNGYPRKDL